MNAKARRSSTVGRRCFGILAAVALTATSSRATTITFTDGTWNLANYSQVLYTNNVGNAGATYSLTQSATNGNPPPSVDFNVTWTVDTTFVIFYGLINTAFTYNPAAGAISGLDFSLDRNVTFTPGTVVQANAAATFLLLQGGNYYVDTVTGPAFIMGTWQTISAMGLQASSFSLYDFNTGMIDPTQHPDFSMSGGVIQFGIRAGISHSNTMGTGFFDQLSDNLSITLTTVSAPTLTSAVSRKTHGAAGTFDIDLPVTGTPGIECRTGGATSDYTMLVTFGSNVTVTGNPQAQVTLGTGCVGSGGTCTGNVTVSSNIVTIPLTNISNAQTINVRINGVNSASDTPATDFTIPMSILVGDTSSNATVNAADVAQTKGRLGQPVDSANFRSDVNANGSLNAADTAIVKQNSGTSLPPP